MSDLASSFNQTKAKLRIGLASVLTGMALAGTVVPAHAQDAPAQDTPAPTTAAADTPAPAKQAAAPATALNSATCMETTTKKKNRNFVIFGNSRSETTTTYNEACGENQKQMARSNSIAVLMAASNADGTPDITLRAMGLQLYRQMDDNTRQHVDAMLQAHGLNAQDVILSITPSGGAAVCVRQPAPAATEGTPVRASVSFRCAAPNAASPAATAPSAVQETTMPQVTAAATPMQPAPPGP